MRYRTPYRKYYSTKATGSRKFESHHSAKKPAAVRHGGRESAYPARRHGGIPLPCCTMAWIRHSLHKSPGGRQMTLALAPLPIAKGKKEIALLPGMANRHGLIAGATGTGKTVTLRVLAEQFSAIGVPVFLADVKGDLSGIPRPGGDNPKVAERATQLKLDGFEYQ